MLLFGETEEKAVLIMDYGKDVICLLYTSFIKPNLLQCDSKNFPVSFVVTEPKGSIGVECGEALLKHGYKLKFFNTCLLYTSLPPRI